MPTPYSGLTDQTIGPFSTINSGGLNPSLGSGFDITARTPIDGRTVVYTAAQRNHIPYVYPGLEVFVLDLNRKYRFRGGKQGSVVVDALDQPPGMFTTDDQWFDVTPNASQYLGAFNATQAFPGVSAPFPSAGSFYLVSVAGTAVINTGNPAIALGIGDEVIYGGSGWDLIPNTTIMPPLNLFHTDIQDWDVAVAASVRLNAVVQYSPITPYGMGQVVYVVETFSGSTQPASGPYSTQQDADITKEAVTLYRAKSAVPAGVPLGDDTKWLMVATNDYKRLANRLVINNATGLGSVLATPLDNGAGVLLDAKEIDRRIGNNLTASQANIGLISGGDAAGNSLQPAIF